MTAIPLLYSDALPLRRASDLPAYRADAASRYLPWVFGRATLAPVPLDTTGQEWLVADHPIAGIDRVTVKEQVTSGWQLVQRTDATGHPIAVLRLSQPTTSDPVAVTVAGRRHPDTGALLTTPAAIVRELLRLCGHAEPRDAWAGLDEHYGQTALGLVFADAQPLLQAIGAIIEPLQAMWRPGWATRRAPGQPVATLDPSVVETISAKADASALRTTARVTYAQDWAAGAPRNSMLLAAPEAVDRAGDLPLDLDLPAVRVARDALAIATQALANAARARWAVTAEVRQSVSDQPLQEGQTVQLAHPHAPQALAVLTSVSLNRESATYTVVAEAYATAAPRVELQRRSAAIDAATAAPAPITYKDGVATFTVQDDQGLPLPGAFVTLDGLYTANTDAQGRVQFKTARGSHTLTVRAPGYADFTLEVVV